MWATPIFKIQNQIRTCDKKNYNNKLKTFFLKMECFNVFFIALAVCSTVSAFQMPDGEILITDCVIIFNH